MPELRYFAIRQFLNSGAYPAYIRQRLLTRIEIEKPELYKQLEQIGAELQRKQQELQKTP